MELELNNSGFKNLIKMNFLLERLVNSEPNSFRIYLNNIELKNFLSINEISINEFNQVTDGSVVFGKVNYVQ